MEGRTPPHSIDAEMSVLGSIMLDNEVYATLEGTLSAEQFYKESHRKIFRAMEKLNRRGDPIDLVTLTEELRTAGELESIGSINYLIGMTDSVPTAAFADSYARIVQEKATLRELIAASGRVMQSAYDQAAPVSDVLDSAEQAILDVATKKRRSNFEGMRTLVTETFADINERFANPDPVSGLRMGFRELDQMTAGLQPSTLNVLAARPAMGKTAFSMTVALNVALRENTPVGVFNFEMSGIQLVTRMLCSEARVDMSRVRNGQLTERDFQRLADTAGRLSEAGIYIDDTSDMTIMELRSRARRLKQERDIGLLVIDYLQLMSGSSRSQSENRQQEISMISRGLKGLARELDIPVLVLSQLSRAVEARPNKRPMLSDLRECVTGDTLVTLADGTRQPIRDLVGQTPEVVAMTPEGLATTAVSDMVWQVGERDVFSVRLASGRTRRTTAKHLWYTLDGWRQLQDLTAGDRIALMRNLPEPAEPVAMADEEVALLGQLIGDGSNERIPTAAFRLPQRQISLLLRHLWATDGCVHVRPLGRKGSNRVYFATSSKLLAQDVAALLARLGIVALIHAPGQPGSAWQIDVSGSEDQRRFVEVVGGFGPRHAQVEALRKTLEVVGPGTNRDTLPHEVMKRIQASARAQGFTQRELAAARGTSYGGTSHFRFAPSRATVASYGQVLQDDALMALTADDLYWDRIVAIEPAGREDVYDLTVPGPASWLADGVVMHNSGAIEQDADLVAFIYRDEYYDEHSEKHGIAEVIIGKQRNGPTGSLEVQFHNSHVRFNDLAK